MPTARTAGLASALRRHASILEHAQCADVIARRLADGPTASVLERFH